MTWSDLATIIPLAIGFALSPAAIIELILVLFSKRRVVNAIAFVVALLVLTTAALLLGAAGANAAGGDGGGGTSTVGSVVVGVLGLLLLVLGVTNWRKRHDTSEPAVFATIAGMGPGAVAFLSLGVTFVNPKNLPLLLGAGATISRTDAPLLSGAVFLLVGTLPYTGAMLYSLLGGESSRATLDRLRQWLIRNNRIIMAIICTLLGLLLAFKGVSALL